MSEAPRGTSACEISANGYTFSAWVGGPESGEPVILQHGFPQNKYAWRHELPELIDAGYRVCAFDCRVFAVGTRPQGIESYTFDHMMADTLSIADTLGYEKFHLVGHDMGGALGWYLACRRADRVMTYSVISRPHPMAFRRSLESSEDQRERSAHHQRNQRPEATDEFLERLATGEAVTRLQSSGVPPEHSKFYLERLKDRDTADSYLNVYRAGPLTLAKSPTIVPAKIPVLYVWGTNDGTVGRLAAEMTKDYVEAYYRFVEVPGAGHFLTDQMPEVFPPLLLEHLKSAR